MLMPEMPSNYIAPFIWPDGGTVIEAVPRLIRMFVSESEVSKTKQNER